MDDETVVETGFLYAARAPGSTIMKVGMSKQRDPSLYIARRYAFVLEPFAIMGVADANMAEKIAFHKLKPWHVTHEIFQALDWDLVQAIFEQTAYLVADRDRCLEYCSEHGIPLVREGRSTKTIHHFEDFAL